MNLNSVFDIVRLYILFENLCYTSTFLRTLCIQRRKFRATEIISQYSTMPHISSKSLFAGKSLAKLQYIILLTIFIFKFWSYGIYRFQMQSFSVILSVLFPRHVPFVLQYITLFHLIYCAMSTGKYNGSPAQVVSIWIELWLLDVKS